MTTRAVPRIRVALAAAVAAGAVAGAPPAGAAPAYEPVLAVGDSVMLGASGPVKRALGPRAVVDAAVSRQFPQGAAAVTSRLRTLRPRTIVIHLGNNGYVRFADMKALLDRLRGPRRVLLVTVRVDRRWERSVNDAYRYAARNWRNVRLVDWNRITRDRPGLFTDGAHLTPAGARLYASTLAAAVRRP